MIWLLGVSALITSVSYVAIQHSQSKERQYGEPPPNNVPVLLVIFLVSLIAAYWMNGMFEGDGLGRVMKGGMSNSAYEDSLVSRIPGECFTGAPPF